MVCEDIFGDCRCYAYTDEKEQFCARRRGLNIIPCSSTCCHGGCPDDGSKQPYRYIDRPEKSISQVVDARILFFVIVFVVILFFRNLKVTPVRRI
jgi:hypothetical protein